MGNPLSQIGSAMDGATSKNARVKLSSHRNSVFGQERLSTTFAHVSTISFGNCPTPSSVRLNPAESSFLWFLIGGTKTKLPVTRDLQSTSSTPRRKLSSRNCSPLGLMHRKMTSFGSSTIWTFEISTEN